MECYLYIFYHAALRRNGAAMEDRNTENRTSDNQENKACTALVPVTVRAGLPACRDTFCRDFFCRNQTASDFSMESGEEFSAASDPGDSSAFDFSDRSSNDHQTIPSDTPVSDMEPENFSRRSYRFFSEHSRKNNDSKHHPLTPAQRLTLFKNILKFTGIMAAASFLAAGIMFCYLILTAPDLDSVSISPTESATYIYDQEGNQLRKLTLSSSNRDIVPLEKVPLSLQQAIISIEDERFYSHRGIDLRGIARAFVKGIRNGSFSEGASTITQQLIKNSVFTDWTQENTFFDRLSRKVQEQYLAIQLEKTMSKDEILENYLNIINLGSGCYGVQAAARRYFGKDVSELTLSESTVLAAIPQNPTAFNPIWHPEKNQSRRSTILSYMQAQGYITPEQKDAALADPVYDRIREYDAACEETSVYSYYEDALIAQVLEVLTEEKGYSYDQAYRAVYSGGLRIISAQDPEIQAICEEEFRNEANFPAGTEYGIDYALSVVDENSLVTHYGSEDLRAFVQENIDPSFQLMCQDPDTAQKYADAFRESILNTDQSAEDLTDSPEYQPAASTSSGSGTSSSSGTPSQTGETASTAPEVLAERLTLSPQPQASLVIIEQTTGFVRAVVGGRGEKTASLTLNRATETTRQPGSTFKILTAYAPALDACAQTLATLYENEPYRYQDGTPVSNWDLGDYSGLTTIRDAIIRSINVAAVRCITEISPQLGYQYALRFGISTLQEPTDVVQPLALGGITRGVTNLELCAAYASIANGGIYRKPRFFTQIYDRHGNLLADYTASQDHTDTPSGTTDKTASDSAADLISSESGSGSNPADNSSPSDGARILKSSTAYLLTDAMQDVVSDPSGTAYGTISAGSQPVAGKTGTTSSYKDIWFTGYTPYYTCCVWGGYDNNESLPDSSTYHIYNKILWTSVMTRVHAALPSATFDIPDSITTVTLCRQSHLPAVTDGCPDTYDEIFESGTEPTGECPLHEPAPETEPILIYQDLLDELLPETEPPDNTESESASETHTETDSDPETTDETDLDSGTTDEAGSATEITDESDSNPGTTGETTTGSETDPLTGLPLPSGSAPDQPRTNSLDDMITQLNKLNLH